MNFKTLFVLAILGIMAGIVSVIVYNQEQKALPPVSVSYNPYENGVYATGIVESYQSNGSNVNIYPEVSGKVTRVFVNEGQVLKVGTPILSIDDSVQREIVAKDAAQIRLEQATLASLQAQLKKIQESYRLDPKSVSQNALDNAIYAVKIQKESVNVAINQYKSDKALLDKYSIASPIDGMILRIVTTTGDYISPLGAFDTFTQDMLPAVQMGVVSPYLAVRCFLNEILVPRLPSTENLEATLFVRGINSKGIPLEFVRIQPYTIPNIELSDEKLERVDVRVLPIIFRFKHPTDINIYAGQLVDIYIKSKV